MIPKECKRLAEVDFPIAAVSRHAVREKSIRHGHPSTLHLWWARRPLASSRAVLMALLLPDPCDPHCPSTFKEAARQILLDLHPSRQRTERMTTDEGLRRLILEFISDFADWDNAAKPGYLNASRALVEAAHGSDRPLVVDPFAGGGSIPLEALRIGCEAFASDLNPVACLILKVMLQDIPRHGRELGHLIRDAGRRIKQAAETELAGLYPEDPDGSRPISYLWARTVRCEAPNCGAEIPLLLTLWLCNKANRKVALRAKTVRNNGMPPHVDFEIYRPEKGEKVEPGTVSHANATCVSCGSVLPAARVRTQLSAQRGGADAVFDAEGKRIGGARLIAVVTQSSKVKGRLYRLATEADYVAVMKAHARLADIVDAWERDARESSSPIPNEPLPLMSGTFNVPLFGMDQWGDLFSARQKVALAIVRALTSETEGTPLALSLALTRLANAGCSLAVWDRSRESHQGGIAGQRIPMVWDFSEANPLSDATGGYSGAVEWVARVAERWPGSGTAEVQPANATDHPLPDESASVWFTDPPYYFAVPYADLSDFFFVWLKRTLPDHPLLRDIFDPENELTPKQAELCEMKHWDPERYGHKDKQFFEDGMAEAFSEGRRVLQESGIGSVVFAHSTTEGWEALLSGMIRGGWTITGSWPIATEMASRLRARESAALATSVHLVCRPRPDDAPVGDWADVLRALPDQVGNWMERLQGEGVRGADLVFACVGPALEIFSRYSRVETAEGTEIGLPIYLERVWEVVGRTALENVLGTEEAQARNGQAGALEEDARLTALFLWTLQSTENVRNNVATGDLDEAEVAKAAAKGFSLPFDVVRRFAQPMGINLEKWTDRIVDQKKGAVRLLPVTSRAKVLFGQDGAGAAADWIESDTAASVQQVLFPELDRPPVPAGTGPSKKSIIDENAELQSLHATALDRLHAAMLLQSSGHSNALRTLIAAEQDRGPEFLRLANALSALYPRGSDEKRLLDGMLLAVPR